MALDTQPATRKPLPRGRRRVRTGEDGRRLWSAGHALVVALLALLLASLLNAQGLHKAAYNRPAGWQRDAALALTGALAGVSHALLLDRPRQGLQALLGRGGADVIDTAVELPATRGRADVAPTPRTRIAFTPERRLRLWVAGDSLLIVPGWSIVRAAGASPAIQPLSGVDGRVATGLARPDVFNWFKHIREQMRSLRPDAVVLGFGANDDHGYMTGLPKGLELSTFGSPAWRQEYRRRVAGVMDTVTRGGGYVVWIGLPLTSDAEQTHRFETINAIAQAEARRRAGRVAFLDTYTLFASDTGGFTEYQPDLSGRQVKVRAADGIHFERAGGDLIAREVLRRLNAAFDLTSWRRRAGRS
jgi:hypothetical protein